MMRPRRLLAIACLCLAGCGDGLPAGTYRVKLYGANNRRLHDWRVRKLPASKPGRWEFTDGDQRVLTIERE